MPVPMRERLKSTSAQTPVLESYPRFPDRGHGLWMESERKRRMQAAGHAKPWPGRCGLVSKRRERVE